jgi:branched-chain amino acid transport system permease protein
VRLDPVARRAWPPFFLCVLLVITWFLVSTFGDVVYTNIAVNMMIYLMMVVGLQIFSGNSGVLSFGHVAFMAVGAYTSTLLTIPTEIKKFTFLTMPHFLKSWIFPAQLSPLEGTLAGAGFATLLALLFAAPIARLSGVAAGIGTLAILVIVYEFDTQTTSITRGTSTQIGVPGTTSFHAVLIWSLLAIVAAFVFQQSRRGLQLRASRENMRAARSVGVRVAMERGAAFVVSGFVVGVAGALFAHYPANSAFSASSFYFDITFLIIVMLVVGGMTSVTGAVVGCYFITIVNEAFRRLEINGIGGWRPPSGTANLILAVVLLMTLILRPKGITAGKEITWPGDWSLDPFRRLARGEVSLVPARFRTAAHPSAPDTEPAASATTPQT